MKIPDSVRIGGVEDRIEYVENLRSQSELRYGEIDFNNSVIRLSTTDGAEHQMRCIILIHEILHGITNHANLDFQKADEEQIIDTLAKGLYAVLQDNGGRLFDLAGDTHDGRTNNCPGK